LALDLIRDDLDLSSSRRALIKDLLTARSRDRASKTLDLGGVLRGEADDVFFFFLDGNCGFFLVLPREIIRLFFEDIIIYSF